MSIKTARKRAGKTQEDVAKACGVSINAVSLWEIGKTMPRAATLFKLADFLKCTVDELRAEDSA